jgi:hypothetical protein
LIGGLFFFGLCKSSALLRADKAPGASTSAWLDVIVEVFSPIVESYFCAGFDALLRPNPYPVAGDEGF